MSGFALSRWLQLGCFSGLWTRFWIYFLRSLSALMNLVIDLMHIVSETHVKHGWAELLEAGLEAVPIRALSHLTYFSSPEAYFYGMQTKSFGHSLGHTSSFMPNFRNFANELGLLTGSDLCELRLSKKAPKVSQVTFSLPFSPPTYNRLSFYRFVCALRW